MTKWIMTDDAIYNIERCHFWLNYKDKKQIIIGHREADEIYISAKTQSAIMYLWRDLEDFLNSECRSKVFYLTSADVARAERATSTDVVQGNEAFKEVMEGNPEIQKNLVNLVTSIQDHLDEMSKRK